MSDETVIIRRAPASFAYLFFVTGIRRGSSAMLDARGTTIGRDPAVEVHLDDPTVSEEHARLRQEDGEWWLYDLAATNRTTVDGESVTRHRLADRARVTFGETTMVFRVLE